MIIMINGSFGVGKTTVAKLLCEAIPDSIFYDPEAAVHDDARFGESIDTEERSAAMVVDEILKRL